MKNLLPRSPSLQNLSGRKFFTLHFSLFTLINLKSQTSNLKSNTMKLKEPWRTIVQIIITVLTTLTTTSCLGHGPVDVASLAMLF